MVINRLVGLLKSILDAILVVLEIFTNFADKNIKNE
jgi:hypothetical protein